MIKLKIEWEDFRRMLEPSFSEVTDQNNLSLFYYVDEGVIRFYKIREGVLFCSKLLLSEIQDLEGFKMEFMRDAIILTEEVE